MRAETVQNYLWAHTVTCPHCHSTIPLSPNWWLSKTSNYAGKGQARKVTSDWYAVKPIPNLAEKRVDFELIKGRKGKGTTILMENKNPDLINNEESIINNQENNLSDNQELTNNHENIINFDPKDHNTIARSVGKCCNCGRVIEQDYLMKAGINNQLEHQLYAVAFKQGKGNLEFRLPNQIDLDAIKKAEKFLEEKYQNTFNSSLPNELINTGFNTDQLRRYGMDEWHKLFNSHQLLTLVTYVEIINEAKGKILAEYEAEKAEAIITYLALVFDRCVDKNCRLSQWHSSRCSYARATAQHALNLMWNYPEIDGTNELWSKCSEELTKEYSLLCDYINQEKIGSIPFLQIHYTSN